MKDATRVFRLAIFLWTLFPDVRLICDFDWRLVQSGFILTMNLQAQKKKKPTIKPLLSQQS